MREQRKRLTGFVVSDKMDKTVVVRVETLKRHRLYHKVIKHVKKYKAHDENNECRMGDRVLIAECRPLSKEKTWVVEQIVQTAHSEPQVVAAEAQI
jgi:small subunit ribosomal protein S17